MHFVSFLLFSLLIHTSCQLKQNEVPYTTSVACTNPGQIDVIMDCRDYDGVINIIWNDTVTFYGEKNSSVIDDCLMNSDSCVSAVKGSVMEGRLEVCENKASCIVEFEQIWVLEDCANDSLNYIEVSYTCVEPELTTEIMTTEIMTTEASEEMTTEEQTSEAPVMQRADVCGDVTGKWRSIHTPEQLTLTLDSDDNLGGMYSPCPNCGWSIVSGRKAALKANLGFMAIGQHGDVVTSWTGRCQYCDGHEVLHVKKTDHELHLRDVITCLSSMSDTPSSEETVYYRNIK